MTVPRASVAIMVLTAPMLTYGQGVITAKQSGNIVSYGDVLQWLFALVLVLALFAGLVYLLKKTGHYANTGKHQLSVVTGLSLGMREKLVLVNVGEKQLLLGVTPGRIDKLMELEGESRLYCSQNTEGDKSGLFAQKLEQLLHGKANA